MSLLSILNKSWKTKKDYIKSWSKKGIVSVKFEICDSTEDACCGGVDIKNLVARAGEEVLILDKSLLESRYDKEEQNSVKSGLLKSVLYYEALFYKYGISCTIEGKTVPEYLMEFPD